MEFVKGDRKKMLMELKVDEILLLDRSTTFSCLVLAQRYGIKISRRLIKHGENKGLYNVYLKRKKK